MGIKVTEYSVKDMMDQALLDMLLWVKGSNKDSFTGMLYTLFNKADSNNFAKLRSTYPCNAAAYLYWYNAKTEQEFIEAVEFLLKKPPC